MPPGTPEQFLTMRAAAEALQTRLQQLRWTALEEEAADDAAYYTERLRYVADLAAGADPDDIFEQNAFRQLFTTELHELTPAPENT